MERSARGYRGPHHDRGSEDRNRDLGASVRRRPARVVHGPRRERSGDAGHAGSGGPGEAVAAGRTRGVRHGRGSASTRWRCFRGWVPAGEDPEATRRGRLMASGNGTPPPGSAEKSLGEMVTEVTEKAQLLVREEI